MGGLGFREHKNTTDRIIPADKIGYLQKADAGANGTLVHFDFSLFSEQVKEKSTATIKQIIESNPNRISVIA